MTGLLERYLFRTAVVAFLTALGILTFMIWLTQALQQLDLLTSQGQSALIFFAVTGLTIPSLVMVIAPIALFIAVIYSLNKLNSDSELIVMSASGMSPLKLLRPYAVLMAVTAVLVASLSLYFAPRSFASLRDLITLVRADFLTHVVREGSFSTLEQGFVFHYRERGPNGELLGVLMQDSRDPERTTTYIAEKGQTIAIGDSNFLVLDKGGIQRQQPKSHDTAMVAFDRYAIDLAQFNPATDNPSYKPRERSTASLIHPDVKDAYYQAQKGRFRAELHDRFVNPLFALAFGMIGLAALGQPRTTRQGRGTAILTAIAIVLALRVGGFVASNLTTRTAAAIPFDYLIPVLGFVGGMVSLLGPPISWPRWRARARARFKAA